MSSGVVHLSSYDLPTFDELFSISDLHMGGRPGFQIFNSGKELAAFIDHVRTRPAAKIVLVINGDLVDFLAEPDAVAFDPVGAGHKLDRIAGDPAFAMVWTALQKFLRAKDRQLVVTLGNHDLELALPWMRDRLVTLLAGGDERARARLTLAFDGAGFLCRVGNASVLCVHGNEVDDWNVADHETIRKFGRDIQQGRPIEEWIPNAGTQLVVQVMNGIKQKFPFVDLLKPELEAVIPSLMAIAPGERDRIRSAIPSFLRLVRDKVRRAGGFLGSGDQPDLSSTDVMPNRVAFLASQPDRAKMLDAVEALMINGVKPIDLVPYDENGQYLGAASAISGFFFGEKPVEVLRQALEKLQQDRSFVHSQEDDTFRSFDALLGTTADFVLTGHTHLERALARRQSPGWYFNSGTWVRLIRLGPEVLADPEQFEKVYAVFAAGSMAALDAASSLVLQRRTVVAIRADADGTRGELMHWDPMAGLVAVEDATFQKSSG